MSMNMRQVSRNRTLLEHLSAATGLLKRRRKSQKANTTNLTLGQFLADLLASKVGSWSFLFVQSTVLLVWIVLNVTPGLPHWDQAPFILLNLVFSFASAYTAPIVLMSQNRQSEIDRQNAAFDHEVNLKARRSIEQLHGKIDSLQEQQILELTQLVKQQQQSLNEIRQSLVPVLTTLKSCKFQNVSDSKPYNPSQTTGAHSNFDEVFH